MNIVDKVRATYLSIKGTSPAIEMSRNVFWRGSIDCTSCRWDQCVRDCGASDGIKYNIGMRAVGGYTIAQREHCIHRSKVGRDAVGNRVLRWRRRIERNAFGGGAGGKDNGRQKRCERGMS